MVELRNVTYTCKYGRTIEYPDWSLRQGTQALVCGKQGTGKTTLLYLLAGLLKPSRGSIEVCDKNITTASPREIDKLRGRYIGLVTPEPVFIKEFTIQDNLLMTQQLGSGNANMEKLYMLLHEFGIAGKAQEYPAALSRLELRLVSILRAVINRPKLILADEPTANLNTLERNMIFSVLTHQARNYESTLVLASSNLKIRDFFRNQLKLQNV